MGRLRGERIEGCAYKKYWDLREAGVCMVVVPGVNRSLYDSRSIRIVWRITLIILLAILENKRGDKLINKCCACCVLSNKALHTEYKGTRVEAEKQNQHRANNMTTS